MKAVLAPITEIILDDKNKLAETLNQNFSAINDMAEEREKAIFSRLSEIKSDLSVELKTSIDNWGANLKAELGASIDTWATGLHAELESKMNEIFRNHGIDPDVIVES